MKIYNLLVALIMCPMLLTGMDEQYKFDSMQENIPESTICKNQYLPNGIRVYNIPAKNSELLIRLIVKSGYITENINELNASLFVEYILSRNIENALKAANIEATVESKAANEFTCFDISISNSSEENRKNVAITIAQIFEKLEINQEEMTDARQNIMNRMNANVSESMCAYIHNKSLYGNTQYEKDFYACLKSIKNLHYSRVNAYYNRNYVPQNMAIVIIGNESRNTKYIESEFAKISMSDRNEVSNLRPLPIGDNVRISIARTEALEANKINIVFKHLNYNIGSYEGFLQDLNCKLISNALYYRLAKSPDMQIIDITVADNVFDSDKKALEIKITCKPENTNDVFARVAEQLAAISNNGFTELEINKAQKVIMEQYTNMDDKKVLQANIDNISSSFVKGMPLFDNSQIVNLSAQIKQFVSISAVNELSREIIGGMNAVINLNVTDEYKIAESDILKKYKHAFNENASNIESTEPIFSIRNK